jgi:hypothetical protein
MRRINYTSETSETIVLELPCDAESEYVPPPQIVIHRRNSHGLIVPVVYHHRGDRPLHGGDYAIRAPEQFP